MDLSRRSEKLEIIDYAELSKEETREFLSQLSLVNKWTLAYRPITHTLKSMKKNLKQESPWRVLDLGCGYGDTLRFVADWARENQIEVQLFGLDRSEYTIEVAKNACRDLQIEFICKDVFEYAPQNSFDLIMSSLFFHHMRDTQIVDLFNWLQEHGEGWLVSDLHRHFVPFYFTKLAVQHPQIHRLIKNDAPLSVARGFHRQELEELLASSSVDISKVYIDWFFPFRYLVRYRV